MLCVCIYGVFTCGGGVVIIPVVDAHAVLFVSEMGSWEHSITHFN